MNNILSDQVGSPTDSPQGCVLHPFVQSEQKDVSENYDDSVIVSLLQGMERRSPGSVVQEQ